MGKKGKCIQHFNKMGLESVINTGMFLKILITHEIGWILVEVLRKSNFQNTVNIH
jgi:hypothetical protein